MRRIWLAEYTTELLNVLHVLGLLVDLEPEQAKLLAEICKSPRITKDELTAANALWVPQEWRKTLRVSSSHFDNEVE